VALLLALQHFSGSDFSLLAFSQFCSVPRFMPSIEELVRQDVDALLRRSWAALGMLSQFDNLGSQNVTLAVRI
jgi:hypothetical protein